MERHSKKRYAGSEAVIELRKALGQTQQAFAHFMKTAIVTVARWETSHPPAGDALLKLAQIAEDGHLEQLRDRFRTLYIREVLQGILGDQEQIVVITAPTKTAPAEGYLIAKVSGKEFEAVDTFLQNVLRQRAKRRKS